MGHFPNQFRPTSQFKVVLKSLFMKDKDFFHPEVSREPDCAAFISIL